MWVLFVKLTFALLRHSRYAWEAHQGGHWAAVMASAIPFGLGAFVLFVGIAFPF